MGQPRPSPTENNANIYIGFYPDGIELQYIFYARIDYAKQVMHIQQGVTSPIAEGWAHSNTFPKHLLNVTKHSGVTLDFSKILEDVKYKLSWSPNPTLEM